MVEQARLTRRRVLQTAAAGTLALAAGPAAAQARGRGFPIKHLVVSCQENRSFDHYYGFAPFVGSHGVPPGYTQPDGLGGSVAPFHLPSPVTPDIGHSWSAMHGEYDAGAMDGFVTTGGAEAVGYYTGADLPFYYSLHNRFTLCTSYFCSVMGPTYPNRFYLAA